MRDEEIDWLCYMTLSRGPGSTTIDELATATGLDTDAVNASASRLERALLLRREGARVLLVSVQESLVLCQTRYGREMPYVIENGVIRARRPDDA